MRKYCLLEVLNFRSIFHKTPKLLLKVTIFKEMVVEERTKRTFRKNPPMKNKGKTITSSSFNNFS